MSYELNIESLSDTSDISANLDISELLEEIEKYIKDIEK